MEHSRVHINMPLAPAARVLSWDAATVDRLLNAAVRVAVSNGIRLDDDVDGIYLGEAAGKGARVDLGERVVRFTHADIEETLAVLRRTSPVSPPILTTLDRASGRENGFNVGNGANLLFDFHAWQARAPGRKDLVSVCQWAQGCSRVSQMTAPVMVKDVDLMLEPMYSYAVMCCHCRKTVLANQPTHPFHVKYLDRMFHVYERHRGYRQPMPTMEYVNPPFRLSSRAVATMLSRVDLGLCDTMGIGSMSVGGMSAPVTVAGLAIAAVAEILCGLSFFRILRPGIGLKAVVCTGHLDLRTARVGYFGMHSWLGNLAARELLVQGVGTRVPAFSWYRDANEPGMQALAEFSTAQAFFSLVGGHCSPEIGGLCNGNLFSPEQAEMDLALASEFSELADGFDVGEAEWGLGEILEGRYDNAHHMASEHTVARVLDGVPFDDFLFRGLSATSHHDRNRTQTDVLMRKAGEMAEASKMEGAEVGPDTDLAQDMYACVEEAAAELSVPVPALA